MSAVLSTINKMPAARACEFVSVNAMTANATKMAIFLRRILSFPPLLQSRQIMSRLGRFVKRGEGERRLRMADSELGFCERTLLRKIEGVFHIVCAGIAQSERGQAPTTLSLFSAE